MQNKLKRSSQYSAYAGGNNLQTNPNLLKIWLDIDIFHPIWQMFSQSGLGQINMSPAGSRQLYSALHFSCCCEHSPPKVPVITELHAHHRPALHHDVKAVHKHKA